MTQTNETTETPTVTIYTETIKEAILDGPLTADDESIVEEQFDNYLEYIAETQSKWGRDVEFSTSLHVLSWSTSDEDECAMDCIKPFWEWYN